jgi:hypothetical protein
METIQDEKKEAFEYLTGISKRLWTRALALCPKWGHDTSNIIESLNGSWSEIRHLPTSSTYRCDIFYFNEDGL